MARVTHETVERIARLARLTLSREECEAYARQLEKILAYAESIQRLDVEGIPPMSHAGESPAFREDAERPGLARDVAVGAAPDAEDGLFRVPRVIPG
jgi:aspartyl-tRNA(Asn)/glutamyl-tRNA(Gln) amidotransferase subunit C